jgi:hypothetical protein
VQETAAPVDGDEREQPVLNFVPLGGRLLGTTPSRSTASGLRSKVEPALGTDLGDLANGDTSGAAEAQSQVAELQRAIDRVIDRAANIRAVYVISNVGAFGAGVVKIGLTRRLEPLDRVRELGGASVPFRFDVHAVIFSDDAVGLETALHHAFAAKRVNLINARRAFFYATVQGVKDMLHRLRGSLLQYVDTPEALE